MTRPHAVSPADGRAIWDDVRASVPLGTGRMMHGTLALADWWTGSFTQAQFDEFGRRTQKIIRAARRAAKVAA